MSDHRLLIIDDHPLLAAGLAAELRRAGAETVLLDPGLGSHHLVEAVAAHSPDAVVLDLGLPIAGGGLGLVAPLTSQGTRVVVLTGQADEPLWARALGQGATTVVSKAEPLSEIVDTVLRVARGQDVRIEQRTALIARYDWRHDPFAELSPREQQVLAGLMDGHAAATLAEQHYVSVATIRAQIRSVLAKLAVGSQLEAVALAHRHRWSLGSGQP